MFKKIGLSVLSVCAGAAAFAEGETTAAIPDIGVDMNGLMTAAGSKLGQGLAIAFGVGFAIWGVTAIYRHFKRAAK